MCAIRAVIETASFSLEARRQRLSDDELTDIILYMARKPKAGELMPGSGGVRKVRIAGRGKGKSGGYRLMSYFGGDDVPVFFFSCSRKVNGPI
jgi:hypothetical protein